MSVTKLPYGQRVKLLIKCEGYPDGRVVRFEIWRRKGQNEEKVSEQYGVTRGGNAYAIWNPNIEERRIKLKARVGETNEPVEEEKYYFIARIDDQEIKSGDLKFTFPVDVYLEDESGRPLHDVDYTITFSDGSKRQGKFKDGHAKVEDAPLGGLKIEVEGYAIEFEK